MPIPGRKAYPFHCRPFRHDWTRWTRPLVTRDGYKQQWRECERCGKAQFRTLPWDQQTPIEAILTALNCLPRRNKVPEITGKTPTEG